ncbi:MAG: phosphatidate cytidylyltransferase [Bacilli bacterium]|nr:phosphatidate cytidylyltransferase [Bacilli bacterium]MDD4608407.1 phosphatidate cytidylyltransferase [Bacilli bacterium]
MKTRIISALIAFAIFIPIFLIGETVFNIAMFVLAIMGLTEFIDMKATKKKTPGFIKFISYTFLLLIMSFGIQSENVTFTIDYTILSALFLSFLLPTVLYHDQEKYSINDAFYLIGGVFFLSLSMLLLICLRAQSLYIIIFLFLITIITDTFALITGILIGKHKLLEKISPKKTWEGLIGGTIMGVFIGTVFYYNVIDPEVSIWLIILVTTFLSIIGQFGDLFFSAIKRYYNKKDFSNIMPGHGGVLDRLDSIIFVLLGFIFLMRFL